MRAAAIGVVAPGEADLAALQPVHRADMAAIGADHFHMLANLASPGHRCLP